MADGTQLIRYDAMCRAIAAAEAIDEVKDIHDKAVAIEAYARQANNELAELQAKRIRERAARRGGELLAEREMAKGTRGQLVGPSKTAAPTDDVQTLADLGISHKQSSHWQQLAQVPLSQFEDAMEQPTIGGLRSAIREVLVATLGPPPDRTNLTAFRRKDDPLDAAYWDLTGAIRTIATLPVDNMAGLAAMVKAELTDWHLGHARQAQARLGEFIAAMEAGDGT